MMRIIPLPVEHDTLYAQESAVIVPYHRMAGQQYTLPAVIAYSETVIAELWDAAQAIERISWKTMRFVQRYLPDRFLIRQLGIDPLLCATVREPWHAHGIARQDWIINDNGLKCIEFNTDTPTGLPEATYLTEYVLHTIRQKNIRFPTLPDPTNWRNPNALMRPLLEQALRTVVTSPYALPETSPRTIVCTCSAQELEDVANTRFVLETFRSIGLDATFVPIESLSIVPGQGLYANDERISWLYRLYPLEYLLHDRDEEGYPIGKALIDLINTGQITVLNPPQGLLQQSKGMLALIWSLCVHQERYAAQYGWNNRLFSEEERACIQRYILPSAFSPQSFIASDTPYVAKSFFGREGRGTTIVAGDRSDISASSPSEPYYEQQPKMYQEYFPMSQVTVPTEQGSYTGYVLTGVFLLGRSVAGILPRVGGRITDNGAFFCPPVVMEQTTQ